MSTMRIPTRRSRRDEQVTGENAKVTGKTTRIVKRNLIEDEDTSVNNNASNISNNHASPTRSQQSNVPNKKRKVSNNNSDTSVCDISTTASDEAKSDANEENTDPDSDEFDAYCSVLAEEAHEKDIQLPPKYSQLQDAFESLEQVLTSWRVLKRVPFFSQIQPQVESSTKRSFALQHLAQIVSVYPSAYKLSFLIDTTSEATASTVATGANKKKYALIVEQCCSGSVGSISKELEQRKQTFRNALATIVKQHLSSSSSDDDNNNNDDNSIGTSSAPLRDEDFPDIPEAKLPERPGSQQQQMKTHADALKDLSDLTIEQIAQYYIAKSSNKASSAVLRTIENATLKSDEVLDETKMRELVENKPIPKELEMLNSSTIAKVRFLEQRAKDDASNKVEENFQRHRVLSKLVLLADMIHATFLNEGRISMYMKDLIHKLFATHRDELPKENIKQQIDMLLEVVPEWCSKVALNKGVVFRIDPHVPGGFREVREKLLRLQHTDDA